jgi:hypothetical protein
MRRLALRVVSTLSLGVVALSCTESPTSAHRATLHIALAPQFSPQQRAIYQRLDAFGVTLDNVHVVVRLEPVGEEAGRVLKDTTIDFPSSATQITIGLDLELQGSEQEVAATVDLRQETTTFFSGSQDFLAQVGETATSPEPVLLSYVGPGASAAFINIDPQPATLALSGVFQFVANVFDAQERPVTGLPITWSTSDASIATVSAAGLVTSSATAGTVTITANGLNGVSGGATINVQPVAKLVVIQGDNQKGVAGGALAVKFTVQAVDANGSPVIGATINFGAVNGQGSVSPASATTDATGSASTTMTLGQSVGTYTFSASVSGTPSATTRVAATAAAAAAAALGIVSGNNQADTVLATLGSPLTVKVSDTFGNPVPQQAIDFQLAAGQGLLFAIGSQTPLGLVHAFTDNTGVAQVLLENGTIAGTVTVTATVSQTAIAPVTFTATVRPGLPSRLVVIQQPSATAQATVPLGTQPKVQVTDLYANPVPLAGVVISADFGFDCSQRTCNRMVPPGIVPPSTSRSPSPAVTRRAPAPATRRLSPTTVLTTRVSVPTTISRTRSVSDTFPEGLGGTVDQTTDANGVARFSNLSLDLPVGPWLLEFFDANEAFVPAISNDIALSPGPIQSIIAWSVLDTSFVFLTVDTLFPTVRVIDKVGNGISSVPVAWKTDGRSTLDSSSTKTDADGFASGGRWIFSFAAGQNFTIQATPTPSNIENSPLTLFAFISIIGRVVPPKVPITPP